MCSYLASGRRREPRKDELDQCPSESERAKGRKAETQIPTMNETLRRGGRQSEGRRGGRKREGARERKGGGVQR